MAYEGLTFDLTPPKTVTLQRLPESDAAVLTLALIFDERRVEEFERQLVELTQVGWPARLVIDLGQVESLAIVGLKPLINLRREHPGTLIALVGPSERVQRVIKLAGFSDFFAIYPAIDDVLSTPQIRETTGQLIRGRYKIEEEVGKSWLGVVFKATDTHDQTSAAIKIISTSFSEQAINQFLHQARQIIRLDHPNVVNVLDCYKEQGLAYIVQEFMEGQTLHEAMLGSQEQRMTLDQAIFIALDIIGALEYAHGRGVIHGDLRPQNIFLTQQTTLDTLEPGVGMVKLTDFGLGRLREGKNLLDEVLVLQMAHYLAPEQILGEPLDARTDLYALGVILYELVTGRLPFEGSDQMVMRAHLNDAPPSLRRANPRLSRSLEHFILKLLAKDPDERYATAHQTQRVLSNLGLRGEVHATNLSGLPMQQQRPLVGRDQPLQALLACWEQARTGRGQLILLAGEAGIGKTRLTQEAGHLDPGGNLADRAVSRSRR